MIRCRVCGAKIRNTITTYDNQRNICTRRRICSTCGVVYRTVEQIEESAPLRNYKKGGDTDDKERKATEEVEEVQ